MTDHLTLLAKASLFALLDDEERRDLIPMMGEKHYDAGEVLFSRGDPGDTLFLVTSGRVRIALENDVGATIELGDNVEGDVFGEVSLFDGGPRTAGAIAIEPTEVLCLTRTNLLAFLGRRPHAALDLLAVMGRRLRNTSNILQKSVTKNLNEEHIEHSTFGQRVADQVAAFGGSWTFIFVFGGILTAWISLNIFILIERFDPYPFILLNLVLSTVAAFQAPVIMMSQNREASKDRLKAELDYEVNLKAELEIAHLHTKVDRLYEILQARYSSEGAPLPPGEAYPKGRDASQVSDATSAF